MGHLVGAITGTAISAAAAVLAGLIAVAAGVTGLAYKTLAEARGEELADERRKREKLERRVEHLEQDLQAMQRTIVRLEDQLEGRRG